MTLAIPSARNDSAKALSRLGQTRTFRGDGLAKWHDSRLHIFGVGTLGQRLAIETVLSGARVVIYDFDSYSEENTGTQPGPAGMRKVDYVAANADAIAPGQAQGVCTDVRHIGIGELASANVLIDCTDDPSLAMPLTQISNGLGVPLLRAAVDGSGEHERGRVACSHGGRVNAGGSGGHACQVCNFGPLDVIRHVTRTPCPGNPVRRIEPTRAGGAIAMTVSGIALLQAQRLVTGNDLDLVLDREWVVDLDVGEIWPLHRQRCEECLSGHLRWTLTPLECRTNETTVAELFLDAGERLESADLTIEFFGHPLCREALCECGGHCDMVGTPWAPAPSCPDCGRSMEWSRVTSVSRISREVSQKLGINYVTLDVLGLPKVGAMIVARAPGKPPLRLVLR